MNWVIGYFIIGIIVYLIAWALEPGDYESGMTVGETILYTIFLIVFWPLLAVSELFSKDSGLNKMFRGK